MTSHHGLIIGSLSIFISMIGSSLTFGYLQQQRDTLGCDALCYGTMQSVRSGLSLIGTVLIGRLSDRLGRATALHIGTLASIFSLCCNAYGNSITAMWISIGPSALLNQNYSVLKALFSDYSSDSGFSESDRASAIGRLGMAVGFSFMIGPLVGASLLKNFFQASLAAIVLTTISGILLLFLPTPKASLQKSQSQAELELGLTKPETMFSSIHKMVMKMCYLPVMQTSGARLLLFMRCFMALAFHVFMTIWTVSLKSRFEFGPKEHAYFMGWVGLCYAISQGLLAKQFIRLSKEDPTKLILVCVVGLSLGRVAVMMTTSLVVVYVVMALVIVCLGVMNTSMASACSHLAGADQVGGLFGVMESAESLAGLLGGLLFKVHPQLPLVSVVSIYSCIFIAVYLFYHDYIVSMSPTSSTNVIVEVAVSEKSVTPKKIQADISSPSFQSPYNLRSKKTM